MQSKIRSKYLFCPKLKEHASIINIMLLKSVFYSHSYIIYFSHDYHINFLLFIYKQTENAPRGG